KNQDEAARISVEIPKKGEGVVAEGDEVDSLAPSSKKKRGTRSNTGCHLLQGGSAKNTSAKGDGAAQEDVRTSTVNLEVPRPVC
ncbi:hypothetical protein A2U01_0087621, partial [Trifolium medium]|nr:hypothetical protein [Trifolium medium]